MSLVGLFKKQSSWSKCFDIIRKNRICFYLKKIQNDLETLFKCFINNWCHFTYILVSMYLLLFYQILFTLFYQKYFTYQFLTLYFFWTSILHILIGKLQTVVGNFLQKYCINYLLFYIFQVSILLYSLIRLLLFSYFTPNSCYGNTAPIWLYFLPEIFLCVFAHEGTEKRYARKMKSRNCSLGNINKAKLQQTWDFVDFLGLPPWNNLLRS